MNFKELTKEQIEQAKKIYSDNSLSWDDRMGKLINHFGGVSERTVRNWCTKLNFKKKIDKEVDVLVKAKDYLHDKTKKRFLISWAQNATSVHKQLFENMEAYAKFIDAQIIIIPGRYHNVTGIMDNVAKAASQEWWDPRIVKYLSKNRHNLNNGVSVLSDISVQPTAVNPLNSLESLTQGESAIVGHPRVHLKTLPVLDPSNPRVMMSTGSCTISNFSESKAGKIGEFHHTLGMVVVELRDNKRFFARQITATANGNFIDLYYSVENGNITTINETLALIKGDIHYGNHDEIILNKSFTKLVPKIKPKQIILHDIFDGYTVNPHEMNNFVKQYENEKNGKNSLKTEIDALIKWLDTIKQHNLVVVFSNHDDFLTRFIINADVKKNVKNALEYMEYGKILLEGKAPNGIIPYIINQKFKNIKCLGRNESYKVKDWELGIHGMDGVNGSRGSIQQYRRLNSKLVSAHAHSPCRLDGTLQCGCNTKLRMGYNNGMSTWALSDVIIHKNAKAQHIIYHADGEYTTFK